VPLYLSEIAPTEIRGAISSLNQLMIVVGILSAFVVNALLAESGAWRWMLSLALIPSVVLLIGMLFMPETPRWLVSAMVTETKGRSLEQIEADLREKASVSSG
jgi:MFS family permease